MDEPEQIENNETQAYRKQAGQLLRVIRCMGWYLLVLALVYFCQTVYCITNLRFIDFAVTFPNPAYAEEMYYYSLAIEKMKIVHCTALFCICIFLVRMTAKY